MYCRKIYTGTSVMLTCMAGLEIRIPAPASSALKVPVNLLIAHMFSDRTPSGTSVPRLVGPSMPNCLAK